MKQIKPIKIEKDMKVSELVKNMGNAGFGANKIFNASRIMNEMFSNKD